LNDETGHKLLLPLEKVFIHGGFRLQPWRKININPAFLKKIFKLLIE